MRAFGGRLSRARVLERRHVRDGLADGRLEVSEIDRLRQKVESAAVHRGADIGHVAVSRDDDGREPGRLILQPGEQGQPIHPRHVDVGHDHVEVAVLGKEGQRLDAVAREAERDRAVLDLTAKLLPDEVLKIRFVVDNEDFRGHEAPSASSRRRPISLRSTGKSIGLVKSPAAPPSIAFRRVSGSP